MNNPKFRSDVGLAPLRILKQVTKQNLSRYLDSRKLLLSDMKYYRDWRGLAEIADIDSSVIRSSKISCTEHCFYLWIQKDGLIEDLWHALEKMERFDVLDDLLSLIYDDFDNATSSDFIKIPSHDDSIMQYDTNIITIDDQHNLNNGGALQFYNALVLFDDENIDFVDLMVQKLEGEYKLKLCLKDRDLVGGLSFESSALMKLIQQGRCAKVIVVLSPSFLQSNANKFLTRFIHALSIEQQRRILIPLCIEPCQKPPEIAFCHSLDYYRTNGFWDYWKKLADSIVYIKPSGPIIRELPQSSVTNFVNNNIRSLPSSSTATEQRSPGNENSPKSNTKNNKNLQEVKICSSDNQKLSTRLPDACSDDSVSSISSSSTMTSIREPLLKNMRNIKNAFKRKKKKEKLKV